MLLTIKIIFWIKFLVLSGFFMIINVEMIYKSHLLKGAVSLLV